MTDNEPGDPQPVNTPPVDTHPVDTYRVVIVGGGFAGVACAKELGQHDVSTVILDRNNYHQFQPLLYQVATGQVQSNDVARPLRGIFRKDDSVDVKTADIVSADLAAHSVTTVDGVTYRGEILVFAAGARPNFFGTPGAEEHAFPLYSVNNANRLRSRILAVFDAVDRDPSYVEKGGLNFVIVGAGATGVETAGALAELIRDVIPHAYPGPAVHQAKVYVVDHGHVVLNGFSDKAHEYASTKLESYGVELKLGLGVEEVHPSKVVLSDGSEILTRAVIWAGGEQASTVIEAAGLPVGRGGRVDVQPDFTVDGLPGVYVLGDSANIPGKDSAVLPQLGSVAQQSGKWAGENILADFAGKKRKPFDYFDKGIMAMIGRNAAVAEVGKRRHEVDGPIAFAAWLGVHIALLSGIHSKVHAFVEWAWDYFSNRRPETLVDRPDAYAIDWDDDEEDEGEKPEFDT